ncbi:MAG: hypothetical protein JWL57_1083 [Actinobacteria bacterium]|nr:hypothetical protein [Actinomycetota bacterium]
MLWGDRVYSDLGRSRAGMAEPWVEDEEPGHHAADEDGVVSSKPDGPQQMRGLTEQYGDKGPGVLAVMETVTSQ